MKKIGFFAIIAMAVMAVCCVKESRMQNGEQIDVPEGYKLLNFTASITKTAISADDTTPAWVEGDQVNFVWNGGSQTVAASASGASTEFKGVLVPETVTEIFAVYPAALSASYAEGTGVTVSFPTEITSGTFADSDICVARASCTDNVWGTALSFKNVACLVKVGITSNVSKIAVKGMADENIAGKLPVSIADDGTVSYGDVADAAASVTLSGLSQPGSFYIPVLPGVTLANGFRIEMWNGETALTPFLYNAAVTTEAGKILGLPELDVRSGNYYVTVSGAGNKSGVNWANAMDVAGLKKLVFSSSSYAGTRDDDADILKYSGLDGATIHMGAGEYVFASSSSDLPTIGFAASGVGEPFTLNIIGGYAGAGSDTPDVENNVTAITGSGEVCKVIVLQYNSRVHFNGITFTGSNGSAGGDACVRVLHGTQYFENCRFVENTNASSAGAMHVGNGQANLTNCSFSGNTALSGAALNIDGNTSTAVTLTDCTFSDNAADQYGGAIRLKTGELEINGGSFTNNTADNQGGAIYVTSTGASVKIDGAEFAANGECSNGDEGQGGAIWTAAGASVEILNSSFSNNSARCGGAIGCANDSSNSNTISIDGCTFSENTSTGVAGAMILTSKGTFTIKNSSFTSNQSGGNGGAIRGSQKDAKVSFDNVIFKNNYASGSGVGGGLYTEDGIYKYNRCCFDGNHGTTSGAFYCGGTSTVYLNACLFTGNYMSSSHGSSVRVWGTNVKFGMNNCTFADNTYTTNSGASGKNCCWIYMKNNTSVLSNNTIIGYSRKGTNGATNSGGAGLIYYDNNSGSSKVTLVNNIIAHSNNQVAYQNNAGTVTMTSVSNKTSGFGGTISKTSSGTDGTGFVGNSASFLGLSYVSAANPAWNNCYWGWNGTLATGNNLQKDTAENIKTAISTADSDFYTWLGTVEGLTKDGQGNSRGTGEWWPGAYQGVTAQ